MNKLLTVKKFLKVNTIFLIPLLLFILVLFYINNFNLNIKNLSETYFNIIFIVLFFPVIFLFYKVFKQIYTLFFQAKLKIAGYELHKKLAVLFSIVCLMPSIIISAFSIFTINTALEGWFSEKISTAVSQSVEVANKYLVEHQQKIKKIHENASIDGIIFVFSGHGTRNNIIHQKMQFYLTTLKVLWFLIFMMFGCI